MNVRKKLILAIFFALIIILSLIFPLVFMKDSSYNAASKLLSLASEKAIIDNQIFSLEALISVDGGYFLDPTEPPDPHIFAYIAIIAEGVEEFPNYVCAPKMWVIRVTDNCCEIPDELPEAPEIWETSLNLVSIEENKLIKNVFGGPVWPMNCLVHVIVQLISSVGEHFLLKATNLRIVSFG